MDRDAVLAEQLGHVLSEIARLEKGIAASSGQPVTSRLLAELAAHRRQAGTMQSRLARKTGP